MAWSCTGRIALVTGGNSGIGAACVTALVAVGAKVATLHHSDSAASDTPDGVVKVLGDVGAETDVERVFDELSRQLGSPDILVNAAGIDMTGVRVADMDLSSWERMLATDLTGSFLTSRRFVRDLRAARRPGSIVNITSIHAAAVRTGGADYAAAKAGQTNLTRTMALECAPDITVNAIAPGMILTPMNKEAVEDRAVREARERNIPAGRAGTAEEVAAVAIFLVSSAARYITGTTITIDGGLSLVMAQGA